MEIKLSNKDYIWSYIGIIVSVGSYLIMTPFALIYLSDDMYGLWGVFQSVSAITLLFDFGFSTTFARNINYCWSGATVLKKTGVEFSDSGEPNFELMKKTIAACKVVFIVLATIALLLMATVGTLYIAYICRTQDSLIAPMIAWAFYGMAIFMSLYYGYYNSFLRGVGAVLDANRITAISRIVQMILTILFLILGGGIVGTGIAYLVYGLLFRILGKRAFYRYKDIGNRLSCVKGTVNRSEIRKIFGVVWHNAGKEGLVTVSNYLANQACTMICSLFLPLSITGVYSLAVQVSTAVSNISGALYTANQPVLQTAYITDDKEKAKDTMSLIVYSFVVTYVLGTVLVITVGLPIIRIIKPEIALTIPIVLGTGLYQFVLKFRNCYTSYFSCTNRIPYVKAFIISAALCVGLAFFSMKYIANNIWSLIVAQIISQLFYNFWAWPIKAHKEMKLTITQTIIRGHRELICIIEKLLHKERKNNA